jgi:microcystin-dependent protein
MNEPFIGSIMMFGFNFAPLDWASCDGQQMSISEYSVLFALLGTTFGGDGIQTFNLPDMRGRVPAHQGQAPGFPNFSMGQRGGEEAVTLNASQMPIHSHGINASSASGDTGDPKGAIFANSGATDREYLASGVANVNMSHQIMTMSGGSQPHDNMQPFLVVNYCIALSGIFPSRN